MSLAGTMEASRLTQADDQLIAAVRRGDDRAYEELYGRYRSQICAFIASRVGDHGRAEDLTQDVFVSALRRLRKTDAPIAFKPWIYEIAKNACIDAYRRSVRSEEVSMESDSGVFDVSGLHRESVQPESAVAAKQQIDDLCGAFGGLSDTHHRILVLRELEGLSYAEIGDRLGMSRPSVESALFRARRRLSEEYEELISGERCRAVQTLLASGGFGRRDERRVARHLAHCVQCRRAAHVAGHDFVATRRPGVATRVAAWLPLPAILRIRRGGLSDSATVAGWSNSVAAVAEPAMGWGKALAATAAMLAAGGAGAVVHHQGQRPAPIVHHVRPLHQQVQLHAASFTTPARHHRTAAAAHAGTHARKPAVVAAPSRPVAKAEPVTVQHHTPTVVGTPPVRATPTPSPAATSDALKNAVTPDNLPSTVVTPPATGSVVPLPADPQTVLGQAQQKLQSAVGDLQSQLSADGGG